MSDRIGIAALSFAHVHAKGYADVVQASPDVDLVAIWDEEPGRGREEARLRGVHFYESLVDVLELDTVQGVVCNAKTSWHERVLTAVAKAGRHIFTEKALRSTTPEREGRQKPSGQPG